MVVCKYFQQGSCRFGQYCRYEHINNYSTNTIKTLDGKNIALVVAEDILAAERGGQWLLSCFGPFKEQPSIPGMEDLSPEEVRWEMYQAEKKGTVDQIKMQFQQHCQDMKTKRDVLKNPTTEIIAMLENLQKSGQETTFGTSSVPKTSTFSFASPQLGTTTPSSASNVFGGKSFGTSGNPFGGNFSTAGGNSLFGGSTVNNSGSVFGTKAAFGSNPVFGSTPSTTSLFGGASKVSTSAFGTQATQSFGTLTSQSSSVFGGSMTSQPVFGQTTAFGNNQNTSFLRPGSTQASTVFGSNTTSTFGTATPPTFGNPNIFGNSGGSSTFGSTSAPAENISVFGQPTTTTTFGTAPVFGATSSFGANQPGSVFGGQANYLRNSTTNTIFGSAQPAANFGSSTTPAINIFGGGTQVAPFGSATNSFGQTTTAGTSFGQTTTASGTPFGSTTTVAVTSFGQTTTTAGSTFGQTVAVATPFATSSGPFGTVTTAPFSQPAGFGKTITSSSNFEGTTSSVAPLTTEFGVTSTVAPTFGTMTNFQSVVASPFAKTNTTISTSPFMATPQVTNSPFGNTGQNQKTFASSDSVPFAKSTFGNFSATSTIDNSAFTAEGLLTDDEKSWYLKERFVLGKIPLKAPTKELR